MTKQPKAWRDRLIASTMGGVSAVVVLAGTSAAVDSLAPDERDHTADSPGAVLEVQHLTEGQIQAAKESAMAQPKLRGIFNSSGVADVRVAPMHDGDGSLTGVLLSYELERPFNGRSNFVILEDVANGRRPVEVPRFNLGIRRAVEIDIVVDLEGRVMSIMPGFGTEYEEPEPGDSVVLATGQEFVFTDDNYSYDEQSGSIGFEAEGMEDHERD